MKENLPLIEVFIIYAGMEQMMTLMSHAFQIEARNQLNVAEERKIRTNVPHITCKHSAQDCTTS